MFPRQNEHLHWSKVYCGVKCMWPLLMHLKIVDLVVGSTVSTSRQVFRGLRRSRGSTVMTGFTLSRHLLGTWETITLYCRLEEVLWNTWEKYFERLWGNTMNKYFERILYQYQLVGTWKMITLYCWKELERRVWERKSWRMPIDTKLCGNASNSTWLFFFADCSCIHV